MVIAQVCGQSELHLGGREGEGGGAKGRICFPLPESQYLTLSLKLVNIKDLVYKSCVDLCKFIVLSTVVALAVRKSVKQLV